MGGNGLTNQLQNAAVFRIEDLFLRSMQRGQSFQIKTFLFAEPQKGVFFRVSFFGVINIKKTKF